MNKFCYPGIFSVILLFCLNLAAKDEIVARIGDRTITLSEFNKRYGEVLSQTVNPPTKPQFLEDLVRYEVGLIEAEKKKIRDNPIVQERIRQELYKGYLETELGEAINKIAVNESEMKQFYKTHPEIRTAHILIEFKEDATPTEIAAAKKRAEEIYKDVKASKRPFEELVRLYTDDTFTKENGGDVGWQTFLTLAPEYYNTVMKMKAGQVSGLVQTRYGFHIVKMIGFKSYARADKRQIRAAVFDQKRKAVFDSFFNKVKTKHKISMNTKLLK
jgi:peptidyl-prolyl cis-trans isomerase C/peptidyl-prolyl cis-trans isomerase D